MNFTSTSHLVFSENNALLYNVVYGVHIKSMHKCVSVLLPVQIFHLQIY